MPLRPATVLRMQPGKRARFDGRQAMPSLLKALLTLQIQRGMLAPTSLANQLNLALAAAARPPQPGRATWTQFIPIRQVTGARMQSDRRVRVDGGQVAGRPLKALLTLQKCIGMMIPTPSLRQPPTFQQPNLAAIAAARPLTLQL